MPHARSSRHRYRGFVEDYKARRLDEQADDASKNGKPRGQTGDAFHSPASSRSGDRTLGNIADSNENSMVRSNDIYNVVVSNESESER